MYAGSGMIQRFSECTLPGNNNGRQILDIYNTLTHNTVWQWPPWESMKSTGDTWRIMKLSPKSIRQSLVFYENILQTFRNQERNVIYVFPHSKAISCTCPYLHSLWMMHGLDGILCTLLACIGHKRTACKIDTKWQV